MLTTTNLEILNLSRFAGLLILNHLATFSGHEPEFLFKPLIRKNVIY